MGKSFIYDENGNFVEFDKKNNRPYERDYDLKVGIRDSLNSINYQLKEIKLILREFLTIVEKNRSEGNKK